MANTTFKGKVRAESGFSQFTTAASTGAETETFAVDTSGNVTTTGDVTVDDQFYVKDGAVIFDSVSVHYVADADLNGNL